VAWLGFKRRPCEDVPACRQAGSGHGSPAKNEVGESEAPQGSAVLPRWGKTNVPAKAQTRQHHYEKRSEFP